LHDQSTSGRAVWQTWDLLRLWQGHNNEVNLVPVFMSRDLCYIVLRFGAIFLLHLEGNKLQSVLLIKQYLIRPRILILCRFTALVKQTRIKSAQGKTVYSNQTDIFQYRIHNYVATILKENNEDGRSSERENSQAEDAQKPPRDLKKVVDNDIFRARRKTLLQRNPNSSLDCG